MIYQWAQTWGVPAAAVEDLLLRLGARDYSPDAPVAAGESAAQSAVRLEASRKGLRLWRNNVGATIDERGNFVRYGICNDSAAVNASLKSSDLIGIRPVTVGGRLIGQFVAREIKAPGWRYTATKRERAQLNFLTLVSLLGGDAAFATGEGTL